MTLLNFKTLSVLIASIALFSGNTNAATTLRFGYEAPRGDTQHEAAKKFNDLLKEKTKGEIKLTLFQTVR